MTTTPDIVDLLGTTADLRAAADAVCERLAARRPGLGLGVLVPGEQHGMLGFVASVGLPAWLLDHPVPVGPAGAGPGTAFHDASLVIGPTGWSTRSHEDGTVVAAPILDGPDPEGVLAAFGSSSDVNDTLIAELETCAVLLGLCVRRARRREERSHDPQTGLADRATLHRALRALVTPNGGLGARAAVLSISAPTHEIEAVAPVLRSVVRSTDLVAHLGDGEFRVVCGHLSHLDDGALTADRISAELGRRGLPYGVAGVVVSAPADPDVVLERVDGQSLLARVEGTASVIGLDAELRPDLDAITEADVLLALDRGEIRPAYQPQFRADDGSLVGAECLARWHRAGTVIPPGRFVPLLEERGSAGRLTRIILLAACRDLVRWREQGLVGEDFELSVNVSATELGDGRLPDLIAEVLGLTGTPARHLCLELTETAALADRHQAGHILTRLRELGVRTAIDDFGTGHASMASLRQLPFDVLKIDRSYVNGLPDRHSEAIIHSLIDISTALGLTVVAEGVEEPYQRDWLASAGVHVLQGYLLGRPVPLETFEADLISRTAPPTGTA